MPKYSERQKSYECFNNKRHKVKIDCIAPPTKKIYSIFALFSRFCPLGGGEGGYLRQTGEI